MTTMNESWLAMAWGRVRSEKLLTIDRVSGETGEAEQRPT
jgi:hypothetical protein